MIWNMTEPSVAIICACLPLLRSLFSEIPKKQIPHSYSISCPPSKAKFWSPGEGEDVRPINPGQGTPSDNSTEELQLSMTDYSATDHSMNEMGENRNLARQPIYLNNSSFDPCSVLMTSK